MVSAFTGNQTGPLTSTGREEERTNSKSLRANGFVSRYGWRVALENGGGQCCVCFVYGSLLLALVNRAPGLRFAATCFFDTPFNFEEWQVLFTDEAEQEPKGF